MKAKSLKGKSPEEIKSALAESMNDGYKPTLAIVFISIKQDRRSVLEILSENDIGPLLLLLAVAFSRFQHRKRFLAQDVHPRRRIRHRRVVQNGLGPRSRLGTGVEVRSERHDKIDEFADPSRRRHLVAFRFPDAVLDACADAFEAELHAIVRKVLVHVQDHLVDEIIERRLSKGIHLIASDPQH